MEASNVTNQLFTQLNFRGERQNVISSNIANINTPNYKTKDLVFSDELDSVNSTRLKMFQTNSKHLSNIDQHLNEAQMRLVMPKNLEEQNDGNNVNLDTQMSEMSKNKILYDAIQSSIKKDSKLFRNVLSSSEKS